MIANLLSKQASMEDVLHYYNANVTYITLPKGINGLVYSYKDINNIFINNALSYYKKKKTIIHELAHIELNHLNQINKELFALKIDKYEDEADKYIIFLKDNINRRED